MHTSKLIAELAFKVHKKLGYGLPVSAYQNGYSILLAEHGYSHTRNNSTDIFFDHTKVCSLTAHFIVEGEVLLEVISKKTISDLEIVKTKRKLMAFGLEEGVLINFEALQVQYRRINLGA